jgi:hypothetical protein
MTPVAHHESRTIAEEAKATLTKRPAQAPKDIPSASAQNAFLTTFHIVPSRNAGRRNAKDGNETPIENRDGAETDETISEND